LKVPSEIPQPLIEKHLFFFDENSLKVATETRLGGPHLEAQVLEYFS
jgi:hypothetical protein